MHTRLVTVLSPTRLLRVARRLCPIPALDAPLLSPHLHLFAQSLAALPPCALRPSAHSQCRPVLQERLRDLLAERAVAGEGFKEKGKSGVQKYAHRLLHAHTRA